jgi:hypothetical protein
MIGTRISDGQKVNIIYEDRGDKVRAFDVNDNPHDAWTAYFQISDGRSFYNQIFKTSVPDNVPFHIFRVKSELTSLREFGYDADVRTYQ